MPDTFEEIAEQLRKVAGGGSAPAAVDFDDIAEKMRNGFEEMQTSPERAKFYPEEVSDNILSKQAAEIEKGWKERIDKAPSTRMETVDRSGELEEMNRGRAQVGLKPISQKDYELRYTSAKRETEASATARAGYFRSPEFDATAKFEEFRKAFPDADRQQYEAALGQYRKQARPEVRLHAEVERYRKEGQSQEEKNIETLKRWPFLGRVLNMANEKGVSEAKARFEAGQARDDDYKTLAYVIAGAEDEAKAGITGQMTSLAAGLPAFLTEFGPAGKAAGGLAAKLGTGGIGKYVAKKAVVGAGATALMPGMVGEQAAQRMAPKWAPIETPSGITIRQTEEGQSVGEAVVRSYSDQFIQLGTMGVLGDAAGAFVKTPLGQKAVANVFGKALAKVGPALSHGQAPAIADQRLYEVLTGAVGNRKDLGLLGDLASGDSDRQSHAMKQLLAEVVVFGGMHAAKHGGEVSAEKIKEGLAKLQEGYQNARAMGGGGNLHGLGGPGTPERMLAEREAFTSAGKPLSETEATHSARMELGEKIRGGVREFGPEDAIGEEPSSGSAPTEDVKTKEQVVPLTEAEKEVARGMVAKRPGLARYLGEAAEAEAAIAPEGQRTAVGGKPGPVPEAAKSPAEQFLESAIPDKMHRDIVGLVDGKGATYAEVGRELRAQGVKITDAGVRAAYERFMAKARKDPEAAKALDAKAEVDFVNDIESGKGELDPDWEAKGISFTGPQVGGLKREVENRVKGNRDEEKEIRRLRRLVKESKDDPAKAGEYIAQLQQKYQRVTARIKAEEAAAAEVPQEPAAAPHPQGPPGPPAGPGGAVPGLAKSAAKGKRNRKRSGLRPDAERPGEAAGVFFHRQPAEPLDAAQIVALQNKLLSEGGNFVERNVPYDPQAAAAALTKAQGVVTGKMHPQDARINLEEHSHNLAVKHGLETDPAKLDPQVAQGFLEFWNNPQAKLDKEAMIEGFGQWLVRRTAGELDGLTPAQEAAGKFAEAWLKDKKLDVPLDRLKPLWQAAGMRGPVEKAAALLSPTGKPAEAELTRREQVQGWLGKLKEIWQDNVTDNLAVLKRAGMERAYVIYGRLMHADKPLAEDFAANGVWVLRDGRRAQLGPSEAKMLEGTLPADIEEMSAFGVSKLEVFAVARHLLGEARRKGTVPVPRWQHKAFEQAMAEFSKDPEFMARATQFAERLTQGYNATLEALASPDIHFLSQGAKDAMIADKPDYVSLGRVKDKAGPRAGFLKGRTGSGEQIISPLLSLKTRYQATAAIINEQIRRNAVADYLLSPGMAKWGLAFEQGLTMEGTAKFSEIAQRLGIADTAVAEIMEAMGPGASAYFDVKPWSSDPSKNSWTWRDKDGKPKNFRIADKALYDLISGIQGEANVVAQIFKWTSRLTPIKESADVVRFGATSASLGFQARNALDPFRDPLTFLENTIDRASIGRLPETLRRAAAFEYSLLRNRESADVVFALFAREGGRQLRKFAGQDIVQVNSKLDALKQLFNTVGAGELGPRFLEFLNKGKQLGWTEERLAKELQAETAAAKSGKMWVDPVPWYDLQQMMHAAAEVTTPFNRQGIVTREINKIVPFFGPAVAGVSKSLRNWKSNPKGAAIGLGAVLAMRLAHWLLASDEDWYKELNANDKYGNFVVDVPGLGLRRISGPRGLHVATGGSLVYVLDKMSDRNPDFKGLLAKSIEENLPPAPVPPIGKVAWDIQGNENWMGGAIVPRREEGLPAGEKALKYQLPYAAQQLTGGRAQLSVNALGVVPFSEVKNANRSVNEWYDQFEELKAKRAQATKAGKRFEREAEYARLNSISGNMNDLASSYKKATTPEAKEAIRKRQIALARRALGR